MDQGAAWHLVVGRDDLTRTAFLEQPVPEPGPDEALLRVDRVGVTANNVTYARLGDALRYWEFFPADEGWGRVPLWGFADVERSNVSGVEEGTRVYGYLPPSSHVVVRPSVTDAGFRDASEHRADLPGPYNIYASTSADPSYRAENEDLQILYQPLFITSFMLDDFFEHNDFFGAEEILVSSASSKTAYGTAFCMRLRDKRPRLVGLTSATNVPFTESLGCYDEVVSYDDVGEAATDRPVAYIDISGSPKLRSTIHERFAGLTHDAIVGMTHDDARLSGTDDLPGPRPAFFFAPDQIRKRSDDWKARGIERPYDHAWGEFVAAVRDWVDVRVGDGRDELLDAWVEVLSGRVDPRVGHVVAL